MADVSSWIKFFDGRQLEVLPESGRKGVQVCKPFAVELYESYQQGVSVEQLSRETGIAVMRIEQRIRAAVEFLKEPSHSLRYLETATKRS